MTSPRSILSYIKLVRLPLTVSNNLLVVENNAVLLVVWAVRLEIPEEVGVLMVVDYELRRVPKKQIENGHSLHQN